MEKAWYKSKTLWFALLKAIAGVLMIIASGEAAFDVAGVALLGEAFVSGLLRYYFTSTKLT